MRKTLIVIISALALVLTLAPPASAKWYEGLGDYGELPATIEVADPKVSKDGYSLNWKIRFTCPALDDYVLTTLLVQRDPSSIPALLGDDGGIFTEWVTTTGVCNAREKMQTVTVTLPVVRPTVYEYCLADPTAPSGSCVPSERGVASADVPIVPRDGATTAYARLEGDSFDVEYCAAPNCAGVFTPKVTFK